MGREETGQFLKAALELAAEQPPRAVPSPSVVMRCYRQVWFMGRGYDRDNIMDNGESYISAESGSATEGVLAAIVEKAGFGKVLQRNVALSPRQCNKIGMVRGECDGLMETPSGEIVVLEFKRKGVFDMLDLLRTNSVAEAKPDEYVQLQCYINALNAKKGLYIAANWDRGAFTNRARFSKHFKDGDRPDAVHVEWVLPNQQVVDTAIKRAKAMVRFMRDVDAEGDVPREYDPKEGKFPCSWCPFLGQCKNAG